MRRTEQVPVLFYLRVCYKVVLNDRTLHLAHPPPFPQILLLAIALLLLAIALQVLTIPPPQLCIAGQWVPQQLVLELEVYFVELFGHGLLLLTADFDSGRWVYVAEAVAVGAQEGVDIIDGEGEKVAVGFGVQLHLLVEG